MTSSFLFAMFHGGGNLHLIMPVVRVLIGRGIAFGRSPGRGSGRRGRAR